jgi:hypothetical protein
MMEKYNSIMKNDVWEIVPRPEGKSLVTLGGSTNSSMLQMAALRSTKLVLWLGGSHRLKELTMMRPSL